jgi:alpha-tubulin suppressor-like RCC1 family protein
MKKLFLFIVTLFYTASVDGQCWSTISGGVFHTAAIKTNGSLWTWGRNDWGQLGDGTYINKFVPTQISGTNWHFVSSGAWHNMAIKTNGTLWAWGVNIEGRLGDGTNVDKNIPTQIGTGTNWAEVSAGSYHTVAIMANGTLWAWGYNHYGQLGDGSTIDKNIPTQIGTGTDWAKVSAGGLHTLAIKTDGTLWAWGENYYGQLGGGATFPQYKVLPTQIGLANNWAYVAAGREYSLAMKSNGSLWAWGYNNYGQLGDGTNIDKYLPMQVGSGNNWSSVSAGYEHSVAIKTDGSIWAWGNNVSGQLGDATNVDKNIPTQVTTTDWGTVSCGWYFTLALKTNSTLWVWGDNDYAQLGDGTLIDKNAPILIASISADSSTLNTSICSNQLPYSWNSLLFSSSGTYTYSTTNATGCDSFAILNLIVKPTSQSAINLLICPLQLPYSWNGQSLLSAGVYTYSTINVNGCDSVATLNLVVNTTFSSMTNTSICSDLLPFSWNGQSLNNTGIYTYSSINANGCDSISSLNLTVKLTNKSITDTSLCSNQLPYNWNGQTLIGAGMYAQSYINSVGCDSILMLNLIVKTVNTSVAQSGYSMWSNAPAAVYQWINCDSNTVIVGATNQGYTTVIGGNYAVIVTQFGCTDTSDCHVIYSVNNSDYFLSKTIQINPNPSNGKIVITTSEALIDASLRIINLTGETIFRKNNLNGTHFLFDISNKANGIYFVELIEGGKAKRMKVIKE